MSTTDLDLRSKILLSVQRALVGCITSEMRFISVEWSRHRIHLHVYVDGVMCEDTYADFDAEAMTQIVADFPYPDRDDPQVSCMFHRCDFPQKPDIEGDLVFGRREDPVA
jgi:hypothetical protein